MLAGGAKWVAVESAQPVIELGTSELLLLLLLLPTSCLRSSARAVGGTPLEEFEHPLDAVYILGSEDAGVPRSILRACHEVVSLRSERYASYNVAVAGSLVLHDRLIKETARQRPAEAQPEA